jgi:hypothetical protein
MMSVEQRQEEIARMKRELANRSLSVLKSRPISFVDRTASDPNMPRIHNPAKATTKDIELCRVEFLDSIWNAPYTRPRWDEVTIDSEAMVVSRITEIL